MVVVVVVVVVVCVCVCVCVVCLLAKYIPWQISVPAFTISVQPHTLRRHTERHETALVTPRDAPIYGAVGSSVHF